MKRDPIDKVEDEYDRIEAAEADKVRDETEKETES